MDRYNPVKLADVDITGGYWKKRQELNRKKTIFAVEKRFRDTGRFEAFKFNWYEGSAVPKPHYFWDSDVAKWIESAAYIIAKNDSPELRASVNEVIDNIEKNQDENGYFNIYHTVVEREERFRWRDHHELYCLGHLIEAAVAWYEATGEDKLFCLMDKYIDHVIKVFVEEKLSAFKTPGHEEIELALIKLYRLKRDKKYLDLAMFFLDNRGTCDLALGGWCNNLYNQSHTPVRQQFTAEGHSVRACYLYSGMADAARETDDEEMLCACKKIFDDIRKRKMHITGGIGATHHGEAFTISYDLPNDTAYDETCAAIALAFFADRMKDIDLDPKYDDVIERAIYNGIMSGVSMDGESFFYENPLEINLEDRTKDVSVSSGDRLPITQRKTVFDCSCCPPNLTRFIADLGEYIASYSDDKIIIHQYISSKMKACNMDITLECDGYPSDGDIRVNVKNARGKKLLLRLPEWAESFSTDGDNDKYNGFLLFDIDSDDYTARLSLDVSPVIYSANPRVKYDCGKVAVALGPVIYCAEQVDNPDVNLADISVDADAIPEVIGSDEFFGIPVLKVPAYVSETSADEPLYKKASERAEKTVTLGLVPYFAFANRGESNMRVWFLRH
ncbi:MAG: glycoside hydrolase family 127 protein [Clostridia bacterium]|nr:glycoside hydrolase family 127 protein [Clostridia bacterium]